MKYLELLKESNEDLKERYELVSERVAEIAQDASDAGTYADYFKKTASYIVLLNSIVEHAAKDEICGMEEAKAAELNRKLYEDIRGEAYETSYANPAYAVKCFGKEAGQILSVLYYQLDFTC